MTKRKAVKASARKATAKANIATSNTRGMHSSRGPMSVTGTGHNKKAKQHITLANRHARHANILAPLTGKRLEKRQQASPGSIHSSGNATNTISSAHTEAKNAHIKAAVKHRKAAKSRKKKS